MLTDNLLQEVPSSIGNLRQLINLNLDSNQLQHLPTTIGSCQALGLLSVRDNLLTEVSEESARFVEMDFLQLPMEVGRLTNVKVLDVSGNRLSFLPFTINVLTGLQALWLAENQSQPLLKLQTDTDPRTNNKVLTCYLLPQVEMRIKTLL